MALLGDTAADPVARALRISALYATFFLEEPFLFRWGGIAAFVSYHIHAALQTPTITLSGVLSPDVHEALAAANGAIYDRLMPDWLRFREGLPVHQGMGPGFDELRRADLLVRTDPVAADAHVYAAVEAISRVEQADVVQPLLDELAPAVQRALAPFYLFRLGLDSAAPTRRFPGTNPVDLDQRWRWTCEDVLPWAWFQHQSRARELRADADRLRRMAGIRLVDLPPRPPR